MTIELPEQLREPDFRFCLVQSHGKKAIEKGWTNGNKYNSMHPKLKTHLANHGNYGVIGGYGNLVILDFDELEAYEKIKNKLPATFTCTSAGKRLPHLYYKTQYEHPNPVKIWGKDKNTLIDVQGYNKYVVGPGSYLKNKLYIKDKELMLPKYTYYTVSIDIPIATIDYDWLLKLLHGEFDSLRQKRKKVLKQRFAREVDDRVGRIKGNISVPQLLRHYGINTDVSPTDTPLADSVRKQCLDFERDVWYCFHMDIGGDVLTMVQEVEGIGFVDAMEWLENTFNLSRI